MKSKSLFFFFIFTTNCVFSQSWDHAFDGGMTRGLFIQVDKMSEVYTITEGLGQAPSSHALARQDQAGNVKWSAAFDVGVVNSMFTDDSSYTYITGYFASNAYFSSANGGLNFTLSSAGLQDAFLVKYDREGNVKFANKWGVNDNAVQGIAVKSDSKGNIFVSGLMYHSITSTGPSIQNYFLYKFNKNGNILWAKDSNWKNKFQPVDLAVDDDGSCYVVGQSSDTVQIGLNVLPVYPNGKIFIAKYYQNGDVAWVKLKGNDVLATCLQVDQKKNILLTGKFNKVTSAYDNLLVPNNRKGMYFVKMDSVANSIWLNIIDNAWGDVFVNSFGDYVIAGSFNKSATFDPVSTNLTGMKFADGFVSKYHSDGSQAWLTKTAGSGTSGITYINGVAGDAFGNILVTGEMSELTVFGTFNFNNPINSPLGSDQFIARIGDHEILGLDKQVNSLFQIYPVPVADLLTIKFEAPPEGLVSITITEISGKIVFTDISLLKEKQKLIELDFLKSGVYIICVSDANKTEHKKIIID